MLSKLYEKINKSKNKWVDLKYDSEKLYSLVLENNAKINLSISFGVIQLKIYDENIGKFVVVDDNKTGTNTNLEKLAKLVQEVTKVNVDELIEITINKPDELSDDKYNFLKNNDLLETYNKKNGKKSVKNKEAKNKKVDV